MHQLSIWFRLTNIGKRPSKSFKPYHRHYCICLLFLKISCGEKKIKTESKFCPKGRRTFFSKPRHIGREGSYCFPYGNCWITLVQYWSESPLSSLVYFIVTWRTYLLTYIKHIWLYFSEIFAVNPFTYLENMKKYILHEAIYWRLFTSAEDQCSKIVIKFAQVVTI